MARKAPKTRDAVLVAIAAIAAAAALTAGAAPPAERVHPTVAALRAGAEALDEAGLPSYARKQRAAADALQLRAAASETLAAADVETLEALNRSLTSAARMWERTDGRKAAVLAREAATVERAIAAVRPLVGPDADGGAVHLAVLTVRIEAPAGGRPGRIVLAEPAMTFTKPEEITAYLQSTAEVFSEATVVFQVDDGATFATVRRAVHAVADAPLNGPMRIEGLELRTAAPAHRLGPTPAGPLPEDLRPARRP